MRWDRRAPQLANTMLTALRMLHKTSRGSKETDEKELQVMPQSLPCQCEVTTVTPVAKQDKALRYSAGSGGMGLAAPRVWVAVKASGRVRLANFQKQ